MMFNKEREGPKINVFSVFMFRSITKTQYFLQAHRFIYELFKER